MSRSGYCDDAEDQLAYGRWRAQVASATRGKRGQSLLKELAEAMDAMPVKRLIAHSLKQEGEFCALGVVGAKRGIKLEAIDPGDSEQVAEQFDIAEPLAREIVHYNDEMSIKIKETPEERWTRMREWVEVRIKR